MLSSELRTNLDSTLYYTSIDNQLFASLEEEKQGLTSHSVRVLSFPPEISDLESERSGMGVTSSSEGKYSRQIVK